jgi:hypothetical protein
LLGQEQNAIAEQERKALEAEERRQSRGGRGRRGRAGSNSIRQWAVRAVHTASVSSR